jgi:hypothetical protein
MEGPKISIVLDLKVVVEEKTIEESIRVDSERQDQKAPEER